MIPILALGSDVEAVATRNGNPISVCGMWGTKEAPMKLPNGGGLQHDGVLVEWNVPPASTNSDFQYNIWQTQQYVNEYLAKEDLVANYISSADYPMSELGNPLAWISGCSADYNAYWKGDENPTPKYVSTKRTVGGHVHISWDRKLKVKEKTIYKALRLMDLHLATPSLFIDTDSFRRTLYGKAGAFRLKDYSRTATGVEYRTLGPWWVDPKYQGMYIDWVFKTTHFIFNHVDSLPMPPDSLEDIINYHDLEGATTIMRQYGVDSIA
jgi:hypothetical protein